jgi:hypothetical protein
LGRTVNKKCLVSERINVDDNNNNSNNNNAKRKSNHIQLWVLATDRRLKFMNDIF